jgi:hypothetical protein
VLGGADLPALDDGVLVDELLEDEVLEDEVLDSLGVGRLSVTYQPLPLNTIPTG